MSLFSPPPQLLVGGIRYMLRDNMHSSLAISGHSSSLLHTVAAVSQQHLLVLSYQMLSSSPPMPPCYQFSVHSPHLSPCHCYTYASWMRLLSTGNLTAYEGSASNNCFCSWTCAWLTMVVQPFIYWHCCWDDLSVDIYHWNNIYSLRFGQQWIQCLVKLDSLSNLDHLGGKAGHFIDRMCSINSWSTPHNTQESGIRQWVWSLPSGYQNS